MKRLVGVLLALALMVLCAVPALAADGNVTYDGNAREFVFAPGGEESLTDLFPNFKDVMPGDSLTQRIHIRNDASRQVKVMVYMRVLGAHEESRDFLSKLTMRIEPVQHPGSYMFHAMADQTAQMTDWVCLGLLYSGGEVDLDVILDVPVELDNKYQKQIGYLDWEFKVEEIPIEPSDPKPGGNLPTGDLAAPELWAGLLGVSVCALWFLMPVRRKGDQA